MAQIPTNKNLTIGGRTFTPSEVDNMIILYAWCGTVGNFATLRLANATAGYQVPSGKTLHMYVCCVYTASSATWTTCQPMYGDNDAGYDAASAPTNAVYMIGYSASNLYGIAASQTNVLAPNYQFVDFTVPQNKFPAIRTRASNLGVTVYGVLV